MKITRHQLRQLIAEEISRAISSDHDEDILQGYTSRDESYRDSVVSKMTGPVADDPIDEDDEIYEYDVPPLRMRRRGGG